MEKLLAILKELRPNINFEDEDKMLIDDGVLDSFDCMEIAGALSDEYDIELTQDDMTPENFNSIKAMLELVERKQDAV